MKTIDIAGIPFSEKMLSSLKTWLIPASEIDDTIISCDITTIEEMQSFLMLYWDELPTDAIPLVKGMLTSLQLIKERFIILSHKQK